MKDRLDVILVRKGLFPSRERAKAAVMAGIVSVDGRPVDKAGTSVAETADICVKENLCPYVSRGGLKLDKALQAFDLDVTEAIAVDMGASTGGFTDCMLQHKAAKVYAIDVGYGQLDWKLRTDDRVINMEKVNLRYLDTETILDPITFITIDVSFISLNLIFPVAARLLSTTGDLVALVKPQFEAGREQVGKKGVVREKVVHKQVLEKVIAYAQEQQLYPQGLTHSPVTGAKGNIEYLLYLKKTQDTNTRLPNIEEAVEAAHSAFLPQDNIS